MEIAFLLLFLIVSLVGVGYPLFRREDRDSPLASVTLKEGLRDLSTEIQTVRRALDDLEFDYTLGKISEPDFKEMRIRLLNEISSIQEKTSERMQKESEAIDEAIEREVYRARETRRTKKGER